MAKAKKTPKTKAPKKSAVKKPVAKKKVAKAVKKITKPVTKKKPVKKAAHKRPSKKTVRKTAAKKVAKVSRPKIKPGDARRRTAVMGGAGAKQQAKLALQRAKRRAKVGEKRPKAADPEFRKRTLASDMREYKRTRDLGDSEERRRTVRAEYPPVRQAAGVPVHTAVRIAPVGQVWWQRGAGQSEALPSGHAKAACPFCGSAEGFKEGSCPDCGRTEASSSLLDPRSAVIYFDLHTEDYNIEDDAQDPEGHSYALAKSLLADRSGKEMLDLEFKGLKDIQKVLGVDVHNEGHGEDGSLVCKFGVNSYADVKRINDIIEHAYDNDEIQLDTPYMVARGFRFYPNGVNDVRFGYNEPETITDWLEAHASESLKIKRPLTKKQQAEKAKQAKALQRIRARVKVRDRQLTGIQKKIDRHYAQGDSQEAQDLEQHYFPERFEALRASSERLSIPPDAQDVHELVLVATNDGELYRKFIHPTLVSLQAKYRAGQYAAGNAISAWRLLVDDAKRTYARDFGANAAAKFNGPVRAQAAVEIENLYRDQISGPESY